MKKLKPTIEVVVIVKEEKEEEKITKFNLVPITSIFGLLIIFFWVS